MNPTSLHAELPTDPGSPARSYHHDDSRQIREGLQSTRCSGCNSVFSDTNFGRHKESSAHRDRMLEQGYHLEPRSMWQCRYLECAPASPARQGRNPGSCSRQDTMKRHYVLKHYLTPEEALKLAKKSVVCANPSPLLSPSNSGEDNAIPAEVMTESCGLYGLGNVGVVRAEDDVHSDATDPYHITVQGPQDTYGPYREKATLSPEVPRSSFRSHFNPALLSPGSIGPGRLQLDVPDPNSFGAYPFNPYTDVSSIGSLSPVSIIERDPSLPAGSPSSLGTSSGSTDWDAQSIEPRSVLLSTTTGDGQHLLPSALDRASSYSRDIAYPYHHGIDAHPSAYHPQLRQLEDGSASLFVPASLTADGVRMNDGSFVPNSVLQQALASYYQRMHISIHDSNEQMLTHLSLNSPQSPPQHDDVFLTGVQ